MLIRLRMAKIKRSEYAIPFLKYGHTTITNPGDMGILVANYFTIFYFAGTNQDNSMVDEVIPISLSSILTMLPNNYRYLMFCFASTKLVLQTHIVLVVFFYHTY